MRIISAHCFASLVACSISMPSIAQVEVLDYAEWSTGSGGNGHYYGHARVRISDATFKQARDAAVTIGGHLTTIANASENEFVRATIGGGIGLYHEANGPWQNVTSEPVTYFNWAAGQPDSFDQLAFAAFCCHPASTWGDFTDAELGNPLDPWSGFSLEWDADCNADGLVDFGQLVRGELPDDNHNWVPDVCETSITGVIPISGPSQGGTIIAINGRNFPQDPIVLIGGVPATSVSRISATRLSATTPIGLPGMTSISVGNFALADAFYYRPECGSDLDQNGAVDGGDMAILLLDWGPCYQAPLAAPVTEVPPLLDAQALPDAPRHR